LMPDERQPTVICAWCKRVLEMGGDGISHGLCDECAPTVLAEITRRLAEAEDESEREHEDNETLAPDSGGDY
jgi:hypothetical protein